MIQAAALEACEWKLRNELMFAKDKSMVDALGSYITPEFKESSTLNTQARLGCV